MYTVGLNILDMFKYARAAGHDNFNFCFVIITTVDQTYGKVTQ